MSLPAHNAQFTATLSCLYRVLDEVELMPGMEEWQPRDRALTPAEATSLRLPSPVAALVDSSCCTRAVGAYVDCDLTAAALTTRAN